MIFANLFTMLLSNKISFKIECMNKKGKNAFGNGAFGNGAFGNGQKNNLIQC